MKEKPIHFVYVGPDCGQNDPNHNTWCRLGDSHDKGYEHGSSNWDDITCKKCLKQRQKLKSNYGINIKRSN